MWKMELVAVIFFTDGLSGEGVTTDNGQWMSMRWVEFGKDYARL